MSGTEHFPTGEWIATGGQTLNTSQLEQRVSIVALLNCNNFQQVSQTLDEFYKQFKETQKSIFIVLDQCGKTDSQVPITARSDWYDFSCTDSVGLCGILLGKWPIGKTYALIDRHQVIRSYYSANTADEKRILLEHMALLLPRDRSEKVELKRGDR